MLIAATGAATVPFAVAAVGQLIFIGLLRTLPLRMPPPAGDKRSARDLFAGFRFVRQNPLFLSAITLDLFGVLFGGAVALLPIFAKDILAVGPAGLGWLRAAPGLGALTMALVTTRLPPWRRPGRVLLMVVAGFGLAMIGFGLSRSFPLSLACLYMTGVFDNVSVVIRLTLEQIITPDHLRGRVSAINYVFIGFSNEFGAFESGGTAALFGPTLSVVGGGVATLLVVAIVGAVWPQLARIGPLHSLRPNDGTPYRGALRLNTVSVSSVLLRVLVILSLHECWPHDLPQSLRQQVVARARHQGAVRAARRIEVHAGRVVRRHAGRRAGDVGRRHRRRLHAARRKRH